jgi:hypothetical protein
MGVFFQYHKEFSRIIVMAELNKHLIIKIVDYSFS